MTPHNQDARPPQVMTNWPTALIVNFVYGCAAIKKWGTLASYELIHDTVHSQYYDDEQGSTKSNKDDKQGSPQPNNSDKGREAIEKAQAQAQERSARAHRCAYNKETGWQSRTMSQVMDLMMDNWTRWKARQQHRQVFEKDVSRNKVLEWLPTSVADIPGP
jgi:hypothetical protein